MNINYSAFPNDCRRDCSCEYQHGLSKLEYTKIHLASGLIGEAFKVQLEHFGFDNQERNNAMILSINETCTNLAKLILEEVTK